MQDFTVIVQLVFTIDRRSSIAVSRIRRGYIPGFLNIPLKAGGRQAAFKNLQKKMEKIASLYEIRDCQLGKTKILITQVSIIIEFAKGVAL